MPKGIKGFQKGHPYGKRFKKGIRNNPKGEFQKGHKPAIPFKKGCKPTHGFKKGHIPYCKLHPECMPRGKNHPNYKGGKIIREGYVKILQPSHPRANCNGYVKHSHLVMEKVIGRYLKTKEQVHHKGIKYPIGSIENKQDDRPENLQLFKNESEHRKFHWALKK